ncbi:MAG: mercury methylation corrinoid protein HgcA [Fibrobacterota bacterium]
MTPAISTIRSPWTFRDLLGAWKARWGLGRMGYRVLPGLYALNTPSPDSPVLVSANYKMSFDLLRRAMAGRPAWLLVIDTKGINVWCAAGKGTFGTAEIVRRVRETDLASAVTHRRLIVPQLGAPGTAAHTVRAETGFSVVYGPVRAADLPAFLDAGCRTDAAMRTATFTFRERWVLVPVEVVGAAVPALTAAALALLLSGLTRHGYSLDAVRTTGLLSISLLCMALLSGAVLTPLFLPRIPGRAFAVKGALTGGLGVALLWLLSAHFQALSGIDKAAWSLMIPAFSSFLAMNFTGATPFTSLSGVLKEMRLAVPLQAGAAGLGIILWIAGRFIGRGI